MKSILFFLSILIILLSSCDESTYSVFSSNYVEFEDEMSDSMLVFMDSELSDLNFKGHLNLDGGSCELLLISALAETRYDTVPVNLYDTIFGIDSIYISDTIIVDFVSIVIIDTAFFIDTIYVDSTFVIEPVLYYNDSIFFEVYEAPVDIDFNTTFDAMDGYWEFFYTIYKNDEEEAPYGDLEFIFDYSD
ncbi:MAG: hypothetical protein PF541_09005 [Prolixibacteraceae bacterium]|jgi:hypothetical protein|nr:hypothetical protein [Prolixibacteraceae bacterium]